MAPGKQMWSSYKSAEKRKKTAGAIGMPMAARVTGNTVGNGRATELASTLKQLIAAYGADEVQGMVDIPEG
jgi:hypothetical protein